ncbi:Fur family transcriptional regulator [Nocardioides alcanivorans]|uniref:Fur family transcriptional regulator n=1 Tax=Nocardioides alcanivorans TaxID=2897352 RepID=UPI001F42FC7B|nr:Fur family transcriptional regulator [Nocardioides alcanivorans]
MTDFADKIHRSGRRMTPQRQSVLQAVNRLGHATPDAVHAEVAKELEGISLSTVYRNLEVLEQLGLVRHAHISDRAPTYHSVSGHEHFHLICRRCGRVDSVDPEVIAPVVTALEGEHGFVPDIGHLTVFGHCISCAEADS